MKCGDPNNPAGAYIRPNGRPCNNNCSVGHNRCQLHGAKAPASKLAAERALAFARMPAIEALYTMIEQWEQNTCAGCGYPNGDMDFRKLIAGVACKILDRTGLGPTSKVEVASQTDGDLVIDHMTPEEKAEFVGIMAQYKNFKDRFRARMTLGQPVSGAALPTSGTSAMGPSTVQ